MFYSEGVLTDEAGALVIKPCTAAEIAFYEETGISHPDFAELIPTFIGMLQLGETDRVRQALSASQTAQAQATLPLKPLAINENPHVSASVGSHNNGPLRGAPLKTEIAIVLENIAAGFVKPNILDIKLGARLWDDDSPEPKRQRLNKVAEVTTSKSLGFRVAGMKKFDGTAYQIFDKFYGRELNAETAHEAFNQLFDIIGDNADTESFEHVLPGALEAVEEIERVVSHQESRMYSSSLLFVYEGDRNARRTAINALSEAQGLDDAKGNIHDGGSTSTPVKIGAGPSNTVEDGDEEDDDEEAAQPKLFDVRVIDFAHSRWTPGQGPDENMLQGIRSVVDILRKMMI